MPLGHHRNPVTYEELLTKFTELTADVIPSERARAVIETVTKLEAVDDCADLVRLISTPG